jgi:hypothetical protein
MGTREGKKGKKGETAKMKTQLINHVNDYVREALHQQTKKSFPTDCFFVCVYLFTFAQRSLLQLIHKI